MNHQPELTISSSPYVLEGTTTPKLMFKVIYALIPVVALATWFFGLSALWVVGAGIAGACGAEWLFGARKGAGTLLDGSGLLTGMLLGLTLPPSTPLWMAVLGGFIAISIGKFIWGGLGFNLFNPALLGRAFLQASFPTALTDKSYFPEPGFFSLMESDPRSFSMPLMQLKSDAALQLTDAISTATPLGMAKFDHHITQLKPLLLGNINGSLGETSALLLIICGLWLGFSKVFNWRGPIAVLLAVALFSGILHLLVPDKCPPPQFMLLSGGLLFGAVFMVTDPVTTPITSKGLWFFGFGLGFLIVMIRVFGGLPEGVMYAILFMNAITPHINRYTQPRQFGG